MFSIENHFGFPEKIRKKYRGRSLQYPYFYGIKKVLTFLS